MEANLTIYESNNSEIFSTSDNKVLSEHHIHRGAPNNDSCEREKSNCELYPNSIMPTNRASFVPYDELPRTEGLLNTSHNFNMPFAPQFSSQFEFSDPPFQPKAQGSPQDDQTESNVRDNASDVSSDDSQRFRSSSPSYPFQTFVGYAFVNVTSRFATHCQCPALDVPNPYPGANPLQIFPDDPTTSDSVDLSPIRAFLSSLPYADFCSKLRTVILHLLRQFSATSEPNYFPILPTSKNPLLNYVNPALLKPMGDYDAAIYLSLTGILPTSESILVVKYQTPLVRIYSRTDATSLEFDDFHAAVFLSLHGHLPHTYAYTPEPQYALRAPAKSSVHLNVSPPLRPADSTVRVNIVCGMMTHTTSTVAPTSSSSGNPQTPVPPTPIVLNLNAPSPTYPSNAQQTAHSALIHATNPSTDPEILRRDSEEITSHRLLLTAEISRVDALVPQIHSFLTQCTEYRTASQNALNLLDAVATTIQSLSRIQPRPQSSTLMTVADPSPFPVPSTSTSAFLSPNVSLMMPPSSVGTLPTSNLSSAVTLTSPRLPI